MAEFQQVQKSLNTVKNDLKINAGDARKNVQELVASKIAELKRKEKVSYTNTPSLFVYIHLGQLHRTPKHTKLRSTDKLCLSSYHFFLRQTITAYSPMCLLMDGSGVTRTLPKVTEVSCGMYLPSSMPETV